MDIRHLIAFVCSLLTLFYASNYWCISISKFDFAGNINKLCSIASFVVLECSISHKINLSLINLVQSIQFSGL